MVTYPTPRTDRGNESDAQRHGLTVILLLAVLTAVEYIFAVLLNTPAAIVIVLATVGVVKAWLIVMYFMHLARVWQGEEAEA